ncbi:MAG: alcohol dehydrogenase [Chitinophagaceae bacterium]|nr:alcohol dehydrogenase [Chitinophagaceae bacterium]
MEKRKLGNSTIEVAPLAFGGNVFGWTIDEQTSFKLLDAFIAAGFNLIDTADSYSRWKEGNHGGESETIIGKWIKQRGNRDKVIIATKVGSDMGQGKNLKKNYILTAVEDSLKRLQTDHIDLYQSHFDDLSTPVEETIDAYAELVKQGKVKAIGASNLSIERLKGSVEYSESKGLPRYETLQPLYNLYDREIFEKEFREYCLEKNISVINYYSLASGFLTGKYRSENDLSKSARGGGIKKYMNERGFKILQALDEVSLRYNTKPATVSIAWLLVQPTIAAPIASATHTEQLNDLISAVDITLDKDAIDLLNKASEY